MRDALLRARGIQLHFGTLGVDRDDRGHAQLGRLLQDQVHLFAAGDALQQGDRQRRFVVQRLRGVDPYLYLALAHRQQRRRVVAAVAVEQHAGIALAQAHHPHQVVGGVLGQGHGLPGVQRQCHGAAGQAHARLRQGGVIVVAAGSASISGSWKRICQCAF